MKKMTDFQARQGDVMLRKVSQLPNGSVKAKNAIVAVGEGHHEHKAIGDLEVMKHNETLYLAVNTEGKLVHVHTGTETLAEHLPIELEQGVYEVIHQRNYNPYADAIERVRD